MKQTHFGGRQNKNPKTTYLVAPTCWHVFVHLVTHVNLKMGTPYDKFKLIPKSRPMAIGVLKFFRTDLGELWFLLWYPNHEYTQLLKTHFLFNLNVNLFDDPWNKTTFIVPHNELRNAINHYMIDIHSKTSKQKCYIIVATNTYKKRPIHNDIKYMIRQTMSISKTQCLTPFLKIYKGMKVIIIKNLYPKLRIINGNIEYIENISFANFEWIQKDANFLSYRLQNTRTNI